MAFLYPSFLFALFALAIPLIIHLFSFRSYRTVYFSNVDFLKNLKEETKSRSQLKQLLILLARMLALASIVLAFAQPYIPVKEDFKSSKTEIVSLYIDNSYSMDAESKYGKILEVAKKKAKEIVESYPNETRFLLVTNDFELKHQHLINKEQFSEYLREIIISPQIKKLNEILSRQIDFLSDANNYSNLDIEDDEEIKNTIYLLSDFQKTTANFEDIKNDSTIKISLIPLATQETKNLYIDSCWFETPSRKINQEENFYVRIVNTANEDYNNMPLKLRLNDSLKALTNFNIEAEKSEVVKLSFTNSHRGVINGEVQLSDYPITYDNSMYFSFQIAEKINLLVINKKEPSNYFNALFENDIYLDITNFEENNVQPSVFSNYHAIFINEINYISSGLSQELANFTANGGTVFFIPSETGELESYNQFLTLLKANRIAQLDTQKIAIGQINYQTEIYQNVFKKKQTGNIDLPVVFKHFTFNLDNYNEEVILKSEVGNQSLLGKYNYEKGKLYVSAFPFNKEASNFSGHVLFVPTAYNIALFSQVTTQIYHIIGQDNLITLSQLNQNDYAVSSENIFHIQNKDQSFDFIPQQISDIMNSAIKLDVQNSIKYAGNYFVRNKNELVSGVSFNYDRIESDLNYFSEKELTEQIGKNRLNNFLILDVQDEMLVEKLQQISQGKRYWKLFVILALLFLAFEIVLIKLWK